MTTNGPVDLRPGSDLRRSNDLGTAGLVLGIAATFASLVTALLFVMLTAVTGMLVSALGMWRAVRVDHGMARSIGGLLLSLFAVVVYVFTVGRT